VRSLSDLAPSEVYLAEALTRPTGGLLHHRFTLTDFSAVYFLLHFLAGYPGWLLTTAVLFGARTFLDVSIAIVLPTHPPKDYLTQLSEAMKLLKVRG
jgi:hypothetical protein